jgi:hypothetical protein
MKKYHLPGFEDEKHLLSSLTQVDVPRSMPFSAAIADYQKHRVKKLKKQGQPYGEERG